MWKSENGLGTALFFTHCLRKPLFFDAHTTCQASYPENFWEPPPQLLSSHKNVKIIDVSYHIWLLWLLETKFRMLDLRTKCFYALSHRTSSSFFPFLAFFFKYEKYYFIILAYVLCMKFGFRRDNRDCMSIKILFPISWF